MDKLCNTCKKLDRPLFLNFAQCKRCHDQRLQNVARRRKRNKSLGLCACGNFPVKNRVQCQECIDQITRSRTLHHEKIIKRRKELMQERRKKVLDFYGRKCNCPGCSETREEFLQIDHVNNNGYLDRKRNMNEIAQLVIKQNFPDTFQILCANCNWGKRITGTCPHLY